LEIWTCDACGREFGKRQWHVCAPAKSVEAYFAARPPAERAIFEAVAAHLRSLGPVIVEPVNVGIFFKGKRTFVELRPKAKWVDLSFGLNRRVDDPRITRTTRTKTSRTYHAVRVREAADLDETVLGWLTESYFELGM
jgi:hypothetical protein